MISSFFSAANSKDGFFSLYEHFPSKDFYLHIIKGGPGTGKSSFMRKIGAAAEAAGHQVEYLLCSGDPDSLDGISIPALKHAWVDGTAPHAREPGIFGIDSDYVNLGVFFKNRLSQSEKEKLHKLQPAYKSLYKDAYAFLNAAAAVNVAFTPDLFGDEQDSVIKKRVEGIIKRHVPRASNNPAITEKRFLSAISCKGRIVLREEFLKLCKLIYSFDNFFGHAHRALEIAAEAAAARGVPMLLCPSPLQPERLEAVLLYEHGLAFVSEDLALENTRNIRIDKLVDASAFKKQLRHGRKLELQLTDEATEKLAAAKQLHDEMEAIYKKHMDFAALDKFCEKEIKKYIK